MRNLAPIHPPQTIKPPPSPRERDLRSEPTPRPSDPNEPDWAAIADAGTD
jgi:hypothetical protein